MKGRVPDGTRRLPPTPQPPRSSPEPVEDSSRQHPALVSYQERARVIKAFKRWQAEGRSVVLDGPTGFYVDRETGEILDLDESDSDGNHADSDR